MQQQTIPRRSELATTCEHDGCAARVVGRCVQCGRACCVAHGASSATKPFRCYACLETAVRTMVACGVRAGQPEVVTAILERWLEEPAYAPFAQRLLGSLLAGQGRYDAALAMLEQAAQRPQATSDIAAQLAVIHLLRAREAAADGDLLQAAKAVSAAARLDGNQPQTQTLLSLLHNWQGLALLQDGAFEPAVHWWEEKLRQEPTNLLLIHQLAILYYRAASSLEATLPPAEQNTPVRQFADACWRGSVGAWAAVLHSSAFWTAWRRQRTQAAGYSVSDEQPAVAVASIKEKLLQDLRDRGFLAPQRFGELERLWLMECKTAELMAQCLREGQVAGWPAGFACGPLMLQQLQRLPAGSALTGALWRHVSSLSHPQAQILTNYLSPLGRQHFLIDENYLDQAILEMEAQSRTPAVQTLLGKALGCKAQELAQLRQWQAALSLFERSHSLGADMAGYADTIAEAGIALAKERLDQEDDYTQTAAVLEQARTLIGTNGDLDANLAATYAQAARTANNRDDFDEAARLIRLALQFQDDDPMTLHFAQVVMANSAVVVAETDMERALALLREAISYEDTEELRTLLSALLYRHILTMAHAKKRERAIALMQERIQCDPEIVAAPTVAEACHRISVLLFHEAVEMGENDRFVGAIDLAQEARVYEDDHETRLLLAQLLYQANRYDEALQILRAEVRAAPGDAGTRSLLVQVLYTQAAQAARAKHYDNAITLLKESLIYDNHGDAQRMLGTVLHNSAVQLVEQDRYDQAIQRFLEALRFNDDGNTRAMLAQTYGLLAVKKFQRGDHWGAKQDLQEALKYDPYNSDLQAAYRRL